MSQQRYAILALIFCGLAAILYNSWPLGYILDNSTARYGLASDLERVNHPYNWLFILGDVLTGLALIAAGVCIRLKLWSRLSSKALTAVYVGLMLFGLFTAVDALIPAQCSLAPVLQCVKYRGQTLGFDSLTSTIAALGLFISLVGVVWLSWQYKINSLLILLIELTIASWIFTSLLFVLLDLTSHNSHLMQQISLVFTGLVIIMVGLNTYAINNKVQKAKKHFTRLKV